MLKNYVWKVCREGVDERSGGQQSRAMSPHEPKWISCGRAVLVVGLEDLRKPI
jgi:hypothetical protein